MRDVVTPFVDDLYPDNVAFLAIHLSDGYQTVFGTARRNIYYPGVSMTIPQAIIDGGRLYYIGYPGLPPAAWSSRVDIRLATPTDVTIDLAPHPQSDTEWEFTADVCLEPAGAAKTVAVNFAFTVDDYPTGYPYTYRKTVRGGAGPIAVDLTPGQCVQVATTLTFSSIELDRWSGVEVVAWAQTPASGWGEAFQAAKFGMVYYDGFESGDLSGWSSVQP